MREVAVIGSGISGLGRRTCSRARTTSRSSSADEPRRAGHAHTVVARRARARHGLPRPQRAQLPAARRGSSTSSASRRSESEMSFSVSCRGCGLEYSGRRPVRAARRTRRARASSRCSGRSAAGCGPRAASLDELDCEDCSLERYLDEHGYSQRFRRHFLVPLDLGALVDRAGPRARVPGRVRDPLLRQPRDARLRALPLAHRDAAAADTLRRRDRATARPRGSASGRGVALAPAQRGRRRAATIGDDVAALRRGRRRHARRPGARAARGSDARDERACSARSRTRGTRRCCTPTRASCRARARARASWNYRARRRRAADDHLLPEPAAGARRRARLLRDAERGRSPTSTCSSAFVYEHPLFTVATLARAAGAAVARRRRGRTSPARTSATASTRTASRAASRAAARSGSTGEVGALRRAR